MKSWWEKILDAIAEGIAKKELKDRGATRSIAFSHRFSFTGYSKEKDMANWVEDYKAACIRTVMSVDLVASDVDGDGKPDTKCNWGLDRIFSAMGYPGFTGLTANAIMAVVSNDADWRKDDFRKCLDAVDGGGLAIAGVANLAGHGHVAALFPGPTKFSGKWAREVPLCANVGKKNGIMGVNEAFLNEPGYFWMKP